MQFATVTEKLTRIVERLDKIDQHLSKQVRSHPKTERKPKRKTKNDAVKQLTARFNGEPIPRKCLEQSKLFTKFFHAGSPGAIHIANDGSRWQYIGWGQGVLGARSQLFRLVSD
ncbi:hypothetical protein [Scytonema sp. UIC 10036]|uniref:hypothetical protein n=1 Tax=Scytonema sp. UIC 10036 TaxID=2304196 RepID=UPI001A9C213C|nr:hypothetical protein [Scytonema sp. UIC 10036]